MKTQRSSALHLRITPQEITIVSNRNAQTPTIQLAPTDIVNHHVVNLTALTQHVEKIIKDGSLIHPNITIEAPFLNKDDSYALLSLALCVSKCGCTVKSISTSNEGPNLLDAFLPPDYHYTYRWFALCGLCLCAAWVGISSRNTQLSHNLKNNTATITQLKTHQNVLKHKVSLTHALEQETATLKKKVTALAAINKQGINAEELCSTIAHTIPATAKLTRMNMEPSSKVISLSGATSAPGDINAWVKKLSTQQKRFKFSLASLAKQKRVKTMAKTNPVLYTFIIQGNA
jgi:Tfp pilus assembly protein PilN